MRDLINQIKKLNEGTDSWYRGYTSNTNNIQYSWLSKDKNHALQYGEINKLTYGGDSLLDEVQLLTNDFLDLLGYDMDENINETDCEEFLNDINIKFDFEDLFDFSEDYIPLSRLVNSILIELLDNCNGFKILESGIETLCVKNNFIKKI